jgi:hypothetical protein
MSPLVAHITDAELHPLNFIQGSIWSRQRFTEALLSHLSHRIDCRVKYLPIDVHFSLSRSLWAHLRLILPPKAITVLLDLLTIHHSGNWHIDGNVFSDSKHLILAHIIDIKTLVTHWHIQQVWLAQWTNLILNLLHDLGWVRDFLSRSLELHSLNSLSWCSLSHTIGDCNWRINFTCHSQLWVSLLRDVHGHILDWELEGGQIFINLRFLLGPTSPQGSNYFLRHVD